MADPLDTLDPETQAPDQFDEPAPEPNLSPVQRESRDRRENRLRAEDLSSRGIPTYRNASGDVSELTDEAGGTLTHYNKGQQIAYDSKGQPKLISYDSPVGPPTLKDPFVDLPSRVDKEGNIYKKGHGLTQYTGGVDPVISAQYQQDEADKVLAKQASLMGRKNTLDQAELVHGQHEHKKLADDLRGAIPALNAPDAQTDLDSVHKAIDEHFDTQYADPAANETAGWFGKGLTPEAQKLREGIDVRKEEAHQAADRLAELGDHLGGIQQSIEENRSQEQLIVEQQLAHSRGQPGPLDAPQGDYGAGNIDLTQRPVVRNDDGSISTEKSKSFSMDGKEVLIPTVAADGSGVLSDKEAIDQYKQTGQFLGKFDTPEQADAYAQELHNVQQERYAGAAPTKPQLYPPLKDWARMGVQPDRAPEAAMRAVEMGEVPAVAAPATVAAAHDAADAIKKADDLKESNPTLSDQFRAAGHGILKGLADGVAEIVKSPVGQAVIADYQISPVGIMSRGLPTFEGAESPTAIAARSAETIKAMGPKVDKALEGTVGGKIGNFAGNVLPYMAGALTGPAAPVVTATLFFSSSYQSTYDDAKAHGASENKAHAAAITVGAINAALALPLRAVSGAAKAVFGADTPGVITRAITNAFEHGGAEAVGNLLGKLKGVIQSGEKPIIEGVAVDVQKQAVAGIDAVLKEIRKTPADRLASVAKTAVGGAAVGGGVSVASNLVRKSYNPDQGTFEGTAENALGFGVLAGASKGFEQVMRARQAKQALDVIAKGGGPGAAPQIGGPNIPPEPGKGPGPGGTTPEAPKPPKPEPPGEKPVTGKVIEPEPPTGGKPKGGAPSETGIGRTQPPEPTTEKPAPTEGPPAPKPSDEAGAVGEPSGAEPAKAAEGPDDVLARLKTAETDYIEHGGHADKLDAQNKLAKITEAFPDPAARLEHLEGLKAPEPAPTVTPPKQQPVKISGVDITLQHQAGELRKEGHEPLGTNYGTVTGVKGADGMTLDAVMKPKGKTKADNPIYVVNQHGEDGSFDEHKVVFGAGSPEEATQLYKSNFPADFKGVSAGSVVKFSPKEFKAWVDSGAPAKKEPAVAPGEVGPTPGTAESIKKLGPDADRVAALDAVKAGTKPVTILSGPAEDFVAEAKERGLRVTKFTDPASGKEVSVAHANNPKAVKALIDAYKSTAPNRHELLGQALGFRPEEIADFISKQPKKEEKPLTKEEAFTGLEKASERLEEIDRGGVGTHAKTETERQEVISEIQRFREATHEHEPETVVRIPHPKYPKGVPAMEVQVLKVADGFWMERHSISVGKGGMGGPLHGHYATKEAALAAAYASLMRFASKAEPTSSEKKVFNDIQKALADLHEAAKAKVEGAGPAPDAISPSEYPAKALKKHVDDWAKDRAADLERLGAKINGTSYGPDEVGPAGIVFKTGTGEIAYNLQKLAQDFANGRLPHVIVGPIMTARMNEEFAHATDVHTQGPHEDGTLALRRRWTAFYGALSPEAHTAIKVAFQGNEAEGDPAILAAEYIARLFMRRHGLKMAEEFFPEPQKRDVASLLAILDAEQPPVIEAHLQAMEAALKAPEVAPEPEPTPEPTPPAPTPEPAKTDLDNQMDELMGDLLGGEGPPPAPEPTPEPPKPITDATVIKLTPEHEDYLIKEFGLTRSGIQAGFTSASGQSAPGYIQFRDPQANDTAVAAVMGTTVADFRKHLEETRAKFKPEPMPEGEPPVPTPKPKPKPKADKGKVKLSDEEQKLIDDAIGGLFATPLTAFKTEQKGIDMDRVEKFAKLAGMMIDKGITTPQAAADFMRSNIGHQMLPYAQALWDAMALEKPELYGTHEWDPLFAQTAPAEEPKAEPPTGGKKTVKPQVPVEKIEDFGEKIGGARKDLWRKRGLALDDLEQMNDAEREVLTTRDNVWPVPDYEALIKDGMPAPVAMLVRDARATLGKHPNFQSYGFSDKGTTDTAKVYVSVISDLRERMEKVRTRDDIQAAWQAVLKSQPNKTGYEIKALIVRKNAHPRFSPSEYDEERAKREIRDTGWPKPQEGWTLRFEITHQKAGTKVARGDQIVTLEKDEFAVSKKGTRMRFGRIVSPFFPTREEAVAWAQDQVKGGGARITRPIKGDAARTGPDYRDGRNVTGEEILETFGFRGGEFGNWTNQADRQQSLNQAYDGLKDLARVLRVPDKAISLDGKMAIAFGARGHGKASAHYEPLRVVINLTKMSGAGALAHEWAHAVDDYFSRIAQLKMGVYASHGTMTAAIPGVLGRSGVRSEVVKAWEDVMTALTKKKADQTIIVAEAEQKLNNIRKRIDEWIGKRAVEMAATGNVTADERFQSLMAQLRLEEPREEVDLGPGYHKYDAAEVALVAKLQNLIRETPGIKPLDAGDAKGLANNAFWATKYYAQLQSAISGEVTRFDPTQFYKNSLAMDKGKKEYWSELHELFARAFESYAQRKIAAEGNTSDYLVHSVKGGAQGWESLYPMSPESEEMDKQFDALWSTIKHEETEKGVRLYATPVAEQQVPIPREKLAGFLRVAESLIKAGINTPKGLSDYMEERYQGRARQYYQAIWNTLGMVRPELRGIHDWVALRAPAPEPEPPATEEPPTPAVAPRSWKVEVTTAEDDGKYFGNGLRFPSEKAAQTHADDLFSRWMSATGVRVVPSEDEPNRNEAGEPLETEPKPDESAAEQIAAFVRDKIDRAERFGSAELFAAADKAYRGTQAAATYTPKDAYDAMELGVNQWILEHAIKPDGSVEEARDKVKALERIINLLPTQTKRTEEQQDFQQFSTPPPFAFAANWVANVTPSDLYAETSAGIGGLAVFGKTAGATVLVNELSDRRAELLRKIFPEVSELDAELWPAINHTVHPTVAVLNPAFSATAGRTASNKTMHGAKQLEVMLESLAPGGRLVAIVGEGMGAMRPAFLDWWKKIAQDYTVRANIPVSGDAYKKYGTSFDNQLLVIDKPLAGQKPEEYAPLTQKVESYADLIPILAGVRSLRAASGTGAGSDQPEGGGTPAGGGATAPATTGTAAPPTDEVVTGTGAESPRPGRTGGNKRPTKPKGGAADVEGGGSRPAPDDTGGLAPGGGDQPAGVAPHGDVVEVGQKTAEDEQAVTEAVFVDYKPAKLFIEGAKPHPTPLVESAAMAAVQPPNPTYKPKLAQEIIKSGALSEAQLEPVVYAGQSNSTLLPDAKTRKGYFIGDGTGVGKGREGAAIILDNINHGRPRAVWLSEKKNLLASARRDLDALGAENVEIEDLRQATAFTGKVKLKKGVLFSTYDTLKGGNQLSAVPPEYRQTAVVRVRAENVNGTVIKSRISKGRAIMSIKLPNGDVLKDVNQGDVDPVKSAEGQKSRLDQLVEWFGESFDGVIILDESHNAANSLGDTSSQKAAAVIALQTRLPNARVVYMSATAATEVSNFAYADRLGLWGPGAFFTDKIDFINKIEAAGLSAMEIIARDLKTLGLFNARTLSFGPVNPDNPEDRGVEFDILQHDLTPEQVGIYNQLANGWQLVFKNLQQVLESTGAGKSPAAKRAARGAFFSSVQRFFNQTLTAMTVPSLLEDMKKELAAGNSAVLQLVNTNEAAQERGLNKAAEEETPLDEIDTTPKQILQQYLMNAFPTALYQPVADSNGKETWVQVIGPDGLPVQDPAAIRKRDALIDGIANLPVPDNPMEQIIGEFGHEAVAEITGRKRRIIQKEVEGKMETVIDKRSDAILKQEAKDFNDGKRRILIFSDKGGTGESYHADRGYLNQQRRVHYLVQAGWRADKAMQGLGRAHRSNQAQPPHIKLLRTNLDAHKRFISTIARRLSTLGALSAGERRSTGQGLFSATDNLENEYSLAALHNLIQEAYDATAEDALPWDLIVDKLGFDNLVDLASGKLRVASLPAVPQFLNRLLSLTFEEGNAVFGRFFAKMEHNIQTALDEGTYDPGLQLLDPGEGGSIEKQHEEIVYTHEESGGQTRLVQVQVNSKAEFIDWAELINRYGKEPERVIENKRSGYLFAIYKAGNITDRKTGAVIPSVRKVSIKHSEIVPERDIADSPTYAIASIPYTSAIPANVERGIHPGDTVETGDGRSMVVLKTDPTGSMVVDREQTPIPVNEIIKIIPGPRREGKFEPVTLADAPAKWAEQIAESDPMHREKKTFLVGLFLPIWNRLNIEKPRVFQFKTTDRERMLGILIPPKNVADVRKKLSLGLAPKSPQEVVDGILNDGMVYQLANGWRLRRARVNQEQRIELVVPVGSPMSVQTRLEEMGLFIERIAFKPRYFVPVGDQATGIITKILDNNPITSEGAAGDTLGATPLPILKPLWDKTVKPLLVGSKEGISELTHRLTRVIAPSTGTLPAAQDELMKMLGGQNQAAYILAKTLKVFEVAMGKMTRAQQVDFVDKYKAGAHQTIPELDALDALLRALDNQNRDLANKAGDDLGIKEMVAWKDNHFRVMWKVVPGQTRPTNAPGGAGRKPLRGSRGMLRESTLDSMSEGIARGGEPFSWNPVTNFKQAQADIMKLTHALRVWKWAKDTKHVVFVKGKFAKAPPGYVALNDAISKVYFPAKSGEGLVEPGQYFVEENFGRQLNNYLSRDLVRESSFGRGLLWLKNATTAIELALSVFHGVFETGEAIGSNIGLGLSQLVNRGLLKGDVSAAFQGMMSIIKSPATPVTNLLLGNLVREAAGAKDLNAYFASKNGQKLAKMFPRAPEYLKYLFEGGWKPTEVEADWKNNSIRAFTESLAEIKAGKDPNYIGAFLRAFPAANEFLMIPLFDKYIPSLKVAQFFREMEEEIKTNDLKYNHVRKNGSRGYLDRSGKWWPRPTNTELARKVWRLVEDRFGELNYDTLFWNRTFKSAMQIMFRSVTWKLGSVEAFAGAFHGQGKEFIDAIKERRAPQLHRNMAWLLGMLVLTAALGTILSEVLGGRKPKSLTDLVFPQIDPKDPQVRVSLPTYFKDLVHLIHSPTGYVTSSMSGWISRVMDLLSNKDYFGVQIRDTDAPLAKQAMQVGDYAAQTLLPFSIRGYKNLSANEVSTLRKSLALLGVNPAPRYISQSKAEGDVEEFWKGQQTEAGVRPQQFEASKAKRALVAQIKHGEKPNLSKALAAGTIAPRDVKALYQRAHMGALASGINHMPLWAAEKVYRDATPTEKAQIEGIMMRKRKGSLARSGRSIFTGFD